MINRKGNRAGKFGKRYGFTIVELLVAVGLFMSIVVVAIGAYLRVLKTQGFITDIMAANDNVSLILEQMAREIRTGDEFETHNQEAITFRNDMGQCVIYSYDSGNWRIMKETIGGVDCGDVSRYNNQTPLSSENIIISNLDFFMEENVSKDGREITFNKITVEATVNLNVQGEQFYSEGNTLKTVVSARKYFKQ